MIGTEPNRIRGRLLRFRVVYPIAAGAILAGVTALLFYLIERYVK